MVVSSLLLAALMAAPQADKATEALLAKMRSAYASTKSAKLTVKLKDSRESDDGPLNIELNYATPRKAYASFTGTQELNGTQVEIATDGKTIKVTTDMGSRRLPYSLDNASTLFAGNLETICFWDYERQLSTDPKSNMHNSKLKLVQDRWQGKTWTVLEESPNHGRTFIRYFVDPSSFMIWRTLVYFLPDKSRFLDFQVIGLERNVAVDPRQFDVGEQRKEIAWNLDGIPVI